MGAIATIYKDLQGLGLGFMGTEKFPQKRGRYAYPLETDNST